MHELRMRAPVVTAGQPEHLRIDLETRGDELDSSVAEDPVRLPLPVAERDRRIEALDNHMFVKLQQPLLRRSRRGEEQQLELFGRQYLMPVEVERDLPIAVSEEVGELDQLTERHAPPARPA